MNKQRTAASALGIFMCVAAGFAESAPLDPDLAYGDQGRVTFSSGQAEAKIAKSVVQPDGKLIVTGSRATVVDGQPGAQMFARRFNVDGSIDTSFGTNGESRFPVLGNDVINMITLQADGKIVLAVDAGVPCTVGTLGMCNPASSAVSPYRASALLRLRADGTPDPAFGNAGVALTTDFFYANALAVQSDGKLLLLGTTGIARARIFNWRLARFNADGSRDVTFNNGAPVASRCDAFGYAIALQSGGRIVVGGDDGVHYAEPSANRGFCIERLLPDGTHDLSFNGGQLRTYFGVNVSLRALTVLPSDGLLAVGRGVFSLDPTPEQIYEIRTGALAARYDSSGTLDPSYGSGGTWFKPLANLRTSLVTGIAEPGSAYWAYTDFTFARDGGFVVGGYEYFSTQNTPSFYKITRDGNADTGFGNNGVAKLAPDPDVPAGFLRDVEDRWYLVSTTTLPDTSAGGVVRRFTGERPESVAIVEFYNVDLKHYFITASVAEAAGIDAGAAGPGWQRTGETIRAWQPASAGSLSGVPQLARTLCRFYGTPGSGPNSHFYTIDAAECDLVRQDPGWTFENYAFYAYAPIATGAGAACPQGLVPVRRLYNNGFPQNDSNHRYTTSAAIYQQMQQMGWAGEGIVFCASA